MTRPFAVLTVVAHSTLLVAAVTCAGVAAADSDEIKSKADVDLAGLRAELITNYGASPGIDMDNWYNIAVTDCEQTQRELSLRVAITIDRGNSVGPMRTSMKYVCPSRAYMVDDALEQIQKNEQENDLACSLPYNQRTEKQQQWVEAIGCA